MKNRLRSFHNRFRAAAVLIAATVAPAAAQEDVMRDAYGFFGSALDVEVATEAPGRIRLIRGQRSRVEVAGRAPDGFTSASLGGHGVRRLTLTALADGPVDFIVSVPEDVRVRVHWEGSNRSELFGTLTRSATYSWDSSAPRPVFESVRTVPEARVTATESAAAPRIVNITSAHRLDRLTVRIGEPSFALSPGQRLDAQRTGDALRILAPASGDIGVQVPADADITVQLDGVDAIVVAGGEVNVLCESVLSQTFADGRRWLTLTPEPLRGCSRGEPARPHAQPGTTAAARRT